MNRVPEHGARLLVACLALLCASPAWSQWFGDVATTLTSNSNLPRAQFAPDRFRDTSLDLRVSGGYHLQPGTYTGVVLGGYIDAAAQHEYTGLNRVDAGLDAIMSHRFGLGPQAPTVRLGASAGRREFNHGARDAWHGTLGVDVDRRFGAALLLSAGVAYEYENGDHDVRKATTPQVPGNAFDLRNWVARLGGEYDLGPAAWLDWSFSLRSGDIVSTGLPYAMIAGVANAITLDSAFGEHATAYRIGARTRVYSVGYNRAFGERSTGFLALEYQDSRGSSAIDYQVGLVRAGYIMSF